MCKICDNQFPVGLIKIHSKGCEEKAIEKKNLIELNIELSKVCDKTYNLKGIVQMKIGIQKLKYEKILFQYENVEETKIS